MPLKCDKCGECHTGRYKCLKNVTRERDELMVHLRWALKELEEKALHSMKRSDMLGTQDICRYCGSKTHLFDDDSHCPFVAAEKALEESK